LKPLILISNDDGIRAPGIGALAERLADLGEILVVAPDRERSATSHAISLGKPLRADEIQPGWWSIDGTPADCIYLAVVHLAPRRPSLVVAGINNGYNLGSDFFYSGTVAAAVEAAIRGIPSFAISLQRGAKDVLPLAASFGHALAHAILAEGLPPKSLLNVNVPGRTPTGYRWTRLGERVYRDTVDARTDPYGRKYFWIGGPPVDAEPISDKEGTEESDCVVVRHGAVSVTPLELDLTSHQLLASLPGWTLPGFEAILEEELEEELEREAPGGEGRQ
jgi:5'-nucleotidase